MKGIVDFDIVRLHVASGHFCDPEHKLCPRIRERDGAIQFPHGIVRPDGTFHGPIRLWLMLDKDYVRNPGIEPCEHVK